MREAAAFPDETSALVSAARHLPAVERVLAAMRQDEAGELDLRAMSEIANLSPFHFARTFGMLTGSPPGEFLAALRLERAKQLLLSTDLRVAEICLEVGYESLGTFTSRFKGMVGISPGQMRRLPEALHSALGDAEVDRLFLPGHQARSGVPFRVHDPELSGSIVFAGLFQTAMPRGRPVAGMILHAPGDYRLPAVPDGCYHLMAAALPDSKDPWELLMPGDALLVGRARGPVTVRGGRAAGERAKITLRSVLNTDPPILVALPALLLERLGSSRSGSARSAGERAI